MPRKRHRNKDEDVDNLSERLADWPLLRLLMLNRPFRWVVILFVLGMVGLALMLPKLWRTTPAGYEPEVRISILDRVQAWSLKRNALRAERNKLPEEATRAWRAAWANNLGDKTALRGLLRTLPENEFPENAANLALQGASWLLRLDNTNRVDIEPIAWAWIRAGISDRVMSLVEIVEPPLDENLERLRLVALFESGRLSEFQAALDGGPAWKRRVQTALETNPRDVPEGIEREFVLVSLAYLAGASPEAAIRNQALEGLRAARNDRSTEQRAYNLEFTTWLNQRDVAKCRALLVEMREIGKDSLRHHTALWRLLLLEGRGKEALDLATQANLVPSTLWEAYQLGQTYNLLGRLDLANDLLKTYAGSAGYLAESLLLRADVLMRQAGIVPETRTFGLPAEEKNQDNDPLTELRSLAIDIRSMPDAMEVLGGYSDFLEGVVEWKRDHRGDEALDAWMDENPGRPITEAGRAGGGSSIILPGTAAFFFNHAVEAGFPTPALSAQVANTMLTLGNVGAWVEPILLSHREQIFAAAERIISTKDAQTIAPEERQRVGRYLSLMVRCAAIRNNHLHEDYLLPAATQVYQLYPNDATTANYYAASLLIYRKDPTTAVSLTLRLLRANPRSRGLAINHAEALLQNRRVEEAQELLRSIIFTDAETKAGIPELSQYCLARFEASRQLGNNVEARQFLARVNLKQLYPPQLAWLEKAREDFEAGTGRSG
ncbi:MAG: hypothetical protein H7A47_09775 [Verrucomicrobiales bacterium]|nr:hypothetical protein [Verrucomicrobiales bacterium]